jgi:KUP system potassium uptake protein
MQDLEANKEVNIISRFQSQEKNNITCDFEFIVMEKFLSKDNELPIVERFIMRFYFLLKELKLTEEKGFGLETRNVKVGKFPLMVSPPATIRLHRIEEVEEIEQL